MFQLKVRKRLVYGAIAIVWIIIPAHVMILAYVSTDIVNVTCIPWGVHSSREVIIIIFLTSYLIPLTLMASFYSRIVYVLLNKVTYV